jgi:hypothetical protein
MSVREPQPNVSQTDYGWAVESEKMPCRGLTNIWKKMPEGHVYLWDGDGWYRVSPPEKQFLPAQDLPHG